MKSFAVIPAAGASLRMGQPKLLLPWSDRRVMDAVLSAWQNSNVAHVVVVLRQADRELAACCTDAGVAVVGLESPTTDMKASVRAGLAHIREKYQPESSDVWLVAPADIPSLSTEVINNVLAAFDVESPQPIVPVHAGQRGHPALFPWSFAERLDALSAAQGINALLTGADVTEIECPGAAAADIDTKEDYGRLL